MSYPARAEGLVNMCDTKTPQVSENLLNILVDLGNAVVWTFSARPPIPNFSSPLPKSLETIQSARITVGVTVILILESIFWEFIIIIIIIHES